MKKLILMIIASVLIFTSCEDPSNIGYVEDFVVEALLIVDEPIQNLTIMRSQPISSIFEFDSAMVKDANFKIIGDGNEFELQYRSREDGGVGYFNPDTNYRVKSGIEYKLEITLKNSKVITGKTFTPKRTAWKYWPDENVQFPIDSIQLPSSDSISWEKVPGSEFFILSIKNLDTLNYGTYLNPPTDEPNRRVYRPFGGPNSYQDPITIFPIPSTQTPIVWNAFRYFGKHQISVYVPDWNFLRWYLQAQAKGEADPLLTSVEGAIGYFGSASVIRYDFFLLKNQP